MFERLVTIREENELTQEDLSNILGIKNRASISKWENNYIIPLERLNSYANYFHVSLDYLVGLSDNKNYERTYESLDRKIIGERLKKIRNKYNLSQRDLAKILNTTSSTISAYESGKTLILTSFAYQICVRYNISLDYLCGKVDGLLLKI